MMTRLVVVLGMAAAVLAGCGHGKSDSDSTPPNLNDALNNHVFELKEVDGQAVTSREVGAPSLSFIRSEDGTLHLVGQMCNSFSGNAKLNDQVLKAPMLVMTKRLCGDDQLNALDHHIGTMLEKGATVEYSRGKLTLKTDANTLVYFIKVGPSDAEQTPAAGGHH